MKEGKILNSNPVTSSEYAKLNTEGLKAEYSIPASKYDESIKRGLRNADGSGVMVGVSKIGSVMGYIIEDGQRIPEPGKLYYRGYDVEEIVAAHRRADTVDGRSIFEFFLGIL